MLWYSNSMFRPMGLFQIPFLGSRPLLIAQKISLISLQLPFQSNAATDSGSIQSLSFFGKAYLPYSATDCKSQGSNIRIKGSPYYSLKTVVLSIICHRIPNVFTDGRQELTKTHYYNFTQPQSKDGYIHSVATRTATHVVKELAVFGGPTNLHDSISDDQNFIVPHPSIHLKCAAHTFKGRCITTGL